LSIISYNRIKVFDGFSTLGVSIHLKPCTASLAVKRPSLKLTIPIFPLTKVTQINFKL
jgi:hypothetical protein